ncbi:MAG: MarR family transcriptional regulator [Candidatus Dormibacteria bacterium]|jgi:DNA-binding MarR family transcriptional regulator
MANPAPPLTEREILLNRFIGLQPALRHRFRATLPAEDRLRVQETMNDVTGAQMEALMLLHGSDAGLSMHELAQALSVTPSSATQLVDRLVRMGLVGRLREDEDRRLVRVQLSDAARQRFEETLHLHLRALAILTGTLTDGELASLVELLSRISQPAATGDAG